jgi:hypothetical protein
MLGKRRIAAVAALALQSISCTVVNELDACKDHPETETQINFRNEGWRNASGIRALASMPGGGSLVVFHSAVSGDKDEINTEIRGTRVSRNGSRLDTCSNPDDYTYAEPERSGPPVQQLFGASIATLGHDEVPGLLVYTRVEAESLELPQAKYVSQRGQIWGRFIDESGCPYPGLESFQISQEDDNHVPDIAEIVPLGDEYVVIWTSHALTGVDSRIRARVLKFRLGPFYQPVVDPVTGQRASSDTVDLRPSGEWPSGVGAVRLSDSEFALAWTTNNGPIIQTTTWLAVHDDTLAVTAEPLRIAETRRQSSTPSNPYPSLAYDGETLLVVWSGTDAAELSKLEGRFYRRREDTLQPTTEALRIGSTERAEEERAATATLGQGRFVVAWEESGADSHADRSGSSIRMTALRPDGQTAFLDPSCDTRDFQLNHFMADEQKNVYLTSNGDSLIQAIWVDMGATELTPRGKGTIRSVAITTSELYPNE